MADSEPATRKHFLDAEAAVVGTSRKIERSEFIGANFTAISGDISKGPGAQRVVDETVSKFGRLDVFGTHGWRICRRMVSC